MGRQHGKESFYKYTTAEVAKIILRNKSLRFSSPLLFNDPFDNQINLNIPFSKNDLTTACHREFDNIIANKNYDTFDIQSQLGTQLKLLMTTADPNDLPGMSTEIKEGIKITIDRIGDLKDALNKEIKAVIDGGVILCVSERNDSLLMWSHYADQHRGVVLELACIDELDNTLLAAEPVDYSEDLPSVASFNEWVRFLTGQSSQLITPENIIRRLVYTKSYEWHYENEWRVWISYNYPPPNNYVDFNEHSTVFKSIYLGCRTSPKDEEELLEIIRQDEQLGHLDIYKAKKSESKFALEFTKITL